MVKVIQIRVFFTVGAGPGLMGAASHWDEAHDARGVWAWTQSWNGWLGGVRVGRGSWCELPEGG